MGLFSQGGSRLRQGVRYSQARVTCDDVLDQSNTASWVQVLAAEVLDHFMLARDQAGVVTQHVGAAEEPALSEQPRDPPQPARPPTHGHSPTWVLKILTKFCSCTTDNI